METSMLQLKKEVDNLKNDFTSQSDMYKTDTDLFLKYKYFDHPGENVQKWQPIPNITRLQLRRIYKMNYSNLSEKDRLFIMQMCTVADATEGQAKKIYALTKEYK